MRILVLSNLYPPAALGGYERLCRDVVDRFRERGHELCVLTTTFGAAARGAVEDPEHVHRRLRMYWDGAEVVCPPAREQVAVERANQRTIGRLVRSFGPDVASVWGMGGMSLGLLSTLASRRVPIVYVVGDDWLVFGRWADCWTRRLDDRPLLRRLAHLLHLPAAPAELGSTGSFCFVSEFTRRRAEEVGHVELRRSIVIPAGIDPVDFPVLAHDERPWRWRLLCVGRLTAAKGFDTAIRALPALPAEATLTIVGSGGGTYRADLERLARELGVADRLRFARSERAELGDYYRAADVLIFPSIGHEGFGLVPLEAMACATPVVATGVGGSAEYLTDEENCLLFAPADENELAGVVRLLGGDSGLRRPLVAEGLATAERFTVDRQTNALEAWHAAAVAP